MGEGVTVSNECLTGMDADVAGEFIAAREATVAGINGTGVRALVGRRFAGARRVAARLHRHQPHR